jgi:gliding motility-associated protein GldM
VPIPIEGNYVVVPKPNSATISADKMNVVYRGVDNPITVSFAGISGDKVRATAPGLSPLGGKPGKYVMRPQGGREVAINVTGTLPDGQNVTDKQVFRIKNIPGPTGALRGRETGTIKGPKSNLEVQTVNSILEDFDFDVNLSVTGFNIKVPGQPTVVVSGNKLDGRARAAVARAQRGDVIIISEIKTKLVGSSIMLPKTAPVAWEVTQ